jgi:hypothetical protein
MVFPIAGGTQDTAYEVENSLRLNDDDSPKLTFTPSSAVTSERKTFTISCWVKRGSNFGTNSFLWEMGGNDNANERIFCRFDSNNRLNVSDSSTGFRIPNRLFRDPSAWYHIVVAFDTTDSTADNRVKVYVNGVQETSFLTSNNPGQNDTKGFSHNSEHTIARTGIDNNFSFDGYMTEFHAVGGSQLDATSFGEFNDNGVWIPKKYTGSHGTNGFYLEFKQTGTSQNSSGIGADTSGNDNHFAVSNLAATDITTDTCTNNFATLNPLIAPPNQAPPTYSEGNTVASINANDFVVSNFNPSNGKWYWEVKYTSESSNDDGMLGIVKVNDTTDWIHDLGTNNRYFGQNDGSWGFYEGNGNLYHNGSSSGYGNSYTANDIIMFAMDLDNAKLYIGENGTWHNSGDPTSGATGTGAISIDSSSEYVVGASSATSESGGRTCGFSFNFGNPPFSISSGNSDGKYGNFEYAVPSGYFALCTKNLAEYG